MSMFWIITWILFYIIDMFILHVVEVYDYNDLYVRDIYLAIGVFLISPLVFVVIILIGMNEFSDVSLDDIKESLKSIFTKLKGFIK